MTQMVNSYYQISGIINSLCILISGVYGFIDISLDRNNTFTNIIVNLSCLIFSFIFLYNELNGVPNSEVYVSKFILFLFTGLLILGTSQVGFILGFIVIFYSLINLSLYYIDFNKKDDTSPSNNIEHRNQSFTSDRLESPPNPYRMSISTTSNFNSIPNNIDVNTINKNGNIIQYGSSV